LRGSASSAGTPSASASAPSRASARAFFFAGARSLMVTHWSVNDQTAALLVAEAMKRVHTGSGINQALREALSAVQLEQRTLRSQVQALHGAGA
jgi:hypothetical protein